VSSTRTWWFVSDLHLGLHDDRRGTAAALVGFLASVADTEPESERCLVLLGDAFDLPADDRAVEQLEAIAGRHADAFDAVRRVLADGTDVQVVCGNHDAALARPPVRDALARLVSPPVAAWPSPRAGRLEVHPWFLFEPGVFLAEHGHQHHDVHRMPTLLSQTAGSASPARSLLTAWSGSAGAGPLRRVDGVRRAVADARRAERAAVAAPYLALVDAESSRAGLPVAAGRALAGTSRFRTLSAAVDVTRRVTARSLGFGRPEAGLRAAAGHVHAALAAHGADVPWLVFGHTHRAGAYALPGTSAGYLNTGTWTDDVRGNGPDRGDDRLFPFVRVDAAGRDGATAAQASLHYWSVSEGGCIPAAGVPAGQSARRR
jgi:hypothetical protein